MLYKVQRYRCTIGSYPPIPAFHFFPGHQPHARKCCRTGKSICPWNGTWREIFFQIAERKKDHQIKRCKKNEFFHPLFLCAVKNVHDVFLLLIPFCPQNPAVNAHNGVIQIYTCFAKQTSFKTEIDVKNGVNESRRINPNIFLPGKPNAYNS